MMNPWPSTRFLVVFAGCLALTACDWFTSPEERLNRAERMVARGEDRAAVIELQNAIRAKPGLFEARLLLADLSTRLGDPKAGLKELEQATLHGATAEQVGWRTAEAHLALSAHGQLTEAIEKGWLAIEEPDRSMYWGLALLGAGAVDESVGKFEAALGSDAELHRARLGYADALAARGQFELALREIETVLTAAPSYALAWLNKGLLLGRRGEAAASAEALLRARELAPGSLSLLQQNVLLVALAEAQLIAKDQQSAENTHASLAVVAPDWPLTHLLGARLALSKQEYGIAVSEATNAIRLAPQLLQARLVLAASLMAQGNLNQAEVQLAQVVQQMPGNVEARKLLAELNLRLQRPQMAVEILNAGDQGPADAGRDALMGLAKFQLGDRASALELLERSAASQPGNKPVQLELATAYLAAGEHQKAVSLLRSMPDTPPDTRRDRLLVAATATAKGRAAATLEMQRIIAGKPHDPETLNIAASYFASIGNLAKSYELLQQILRVDPKNAGALMSLARLEASRDNFTEARALLERAAKIGDAGNANLQLAILLVAQGEIPEAVRLLEEIRKSNSSDVDARLVLARMYARQKKNAGEIDELIREALAAGRESAAVSHAVGVIYQDAGRFEEALGSFRNAVDRSPRTAEYLLSLGRAQLARGDASAARESFERAVAVEPGSLNANGALAMLDVREGMTDRGVSRIDELKRTLPKSDRLSSLEGDVAMAARIPDRAAAAYAEAMQLNPSSTTAIRLYRARSLARLPNALQPLEDWLRRRPDDEPVSLALAEAHMTAGNTRTAIPVYEHAIQRNPRNATALNNLAWLYHKENDSRAVATAAGAYALSPANPAIADTYGWILVQQGNVAEGLAVLERIEPTARTNPDIRYHYAYALAEAGRYDAAGEHLHALMQISAEYARDPEVQRLMRKVSE